MKTPIYPLIISLLCFAGLYAQETEKATETTTTLYEYGRPVSHSEDNIKNLFRNFPIYVENGKEIDFRSYKYLGTIKDDRDAEKYVALNFKNTLPIGLVISLPSSNTSNKNTNDEPSHIRLVPDNNKPGKSDEKEMITTIAKEYVHTGDEVFVIYYVYGLKKYSHYVFINPDTKKVVSKGNPFAYEIPQAHIEAVNRAK